MNLLGQEVKHKVFGKGTITNQCENKITVHFEESDKLFLYPDAIPRYLIFLDSSIQRQMESMSQEREREICERKQKIDKENEYRNRLYRMKILPKSQVAYNILQNDFSNLEYLETGCYLSGSTKGLPRVPVNIQPNSAMVLTNSCSDNEDDRKIIGVVMADEKFWGKECKDGRIHLHEKYQLILPEEQQVSFWKYFNRKDFSSNWGSIPFKYIPCEAMEKILLDVCQSTAGTAKEEEAFKVYQYFCKLNRLTEKYTLHCI